MQAQSHCLGTLERSTSHARLSIRDANTLPIEERQSAQRATGSGEACEAAETERGQAELRLSLRLARA